MERDHAQRIIARVQDGSSLRAACREEDGTVQSFLRACEADAGIADQYAHAREIGNDAEFEALTEFAAQLPETGPSGAVDAGYVAWMRLQVDTRKWALSKKAPKKYGDRTEVEHTGRVTHAHEMSDDDLAAYLKG